MDEGTSFFIGVFVGLIILLTVLGIKCAKDQGIEYETLNVPKQTCVTVYGFYGSSTNLCAGDCINKGPIELCYKPKPEKDQ